MSYFHLRLDYRTADDLARYVDFVTRLPGKDKIIVLERKTTNDKPHLHSIFIHDKTESTVRQQFMKKFEDYKGRGKEYQLKQIPDVELYDAEKYICKGETTLDSPDIILQTGKYNIEYTVKLHIAYWELNAFVNKNKTQVQNGTMEPFITVTHRVEKVVKPKKNFYNDVIDYLHLQYPEKEWTLNDTVLMYYGIMKLHGKHFRPYGPQQIENEMNVIMNILCHARHCENMLQVLKDRRNIPNL